MPLHLVKSVEVANTESEINWWRFIRFRGWFLSIGALLICATRDLNGKVWRALPKKLGGMDGVVSGDVLPGPWAQHQGLLGLRRPHSMFSTLVKVVLHLV